MLASAVLWLCGVDRKDIIADYEVSFTYNQGGLNAIADNLPDRERFMPLLRSDAENMERLLDFYQEFGLAHRLEENGFTADEQRRLRERMVQL